MPNNSIITYRPDITRPVRPVKGDVDITVRTPEAEEKEANEGRQEIKQLLDQAIEVDQQLQDLRKELIEQSSEMSISIDPSDRPLLAEAIYRLSGGEQNHTIDYTVFDTAVRVIQNSFPVQYGFEPSQLLLSDIDGDGHSLPKVKFPQNMNCNDVADFSLNKNSTSDTHTIEAAIEQRQRNMQFGLLGMLWKMLLMFLYRMIAKMLRKTKLHKVPIAGRTVKKIIKKLEKEANKLEAWLRNGGGMDWSSMDSDVQEMSGQSGEAAGEGDQANECIMASQKVIDHSMHWALYHNDKESDVNPEAILLRIMLEKEQDLHEAAKFNLQLLVHEGEFTEETEQLKKVTRSNTAYDNRYLNRTITKGIA